MSIPALLYGGSGDQIYHDFHQSDSSYSFRGSFIVEAEPDCLRSVVSDFGHISRYASGAVNVELIRKGDDWTEVSYTYRRFLFLENQSIWRRTLYPDKNELVFEMLSSKNNMKLMPDMLSSRGYYRISDAEDFHRMEYFQECTLDTDMIRGFYIRTVKREAIRFLHMFRAYIERTCVGEPAEYKP